MIEVGDLHHKAMAHADDALAARRAGKFLKASRLFTSAYELERRAAETAVSGSTGEPTRSVLLRSAASLALECQEIREAERLISLALAGSPPPEILEELRDLLEMVYFNRHLSLRGRKLEPFEFQMSLIGPAVGLGMVEAHLFLSKAQIVENLLIRTVERRKGIPFREFGKPAIETIQDFEPYFSTPQAASFAVGIRIGRSLVRQRLIPGVVTPEAIVDDFLQSIRLIEQDHQEELKGRFDDDAYYRNFAGLARKLAPDGERITAVGFTTGGGKHESSVALTKRPKPPLIASHDNGEGFTTVTGRLRRADSLDLNKRRITLVNDENGQKRTIQVPSGMMNDIVRPLWDQLVRAKCLRPKKGPLELLDVEAIQDGQE